MKSIKSAAAVLLSGALALSAGACTDAGESPRNEAAPADIEILPPDESVAPPTEDLANGAVEAPAGNDSDAGPATAIPAALHGRWGLTANDCDPGRSDAKGLVTIDDESIRFYESIARPDDIAERGPNLIRGTFAFIGEGTTWSSPMRWSVDGDRLTRLDSERESRLVYTRC